MGFLAVDGSYGEGGGQILRTALSFSIIQRRPVHISKIRAWREVPGVRPQHAAVLRILRDISGGVLEGGNVGSTEVFFTPDQVESRTLKMDLGTAASITLVLQAIVPAVSLSGATLEVELIGGTDVPWSPTADYFKVVVVPALRSMGLVVEFDVRRSGYYPRGGGRARAVIHSSSSLQSLNLSERKSSPVVSVYSRCGRLPRHVAERQAASAVSRLKQEGIEVQKVNISTGESTSPGSSLLVSARDSTCFIGSDAIGARGRPAEQVGEHAAFEFIRTYGSGSTVDTHLADMLAPLLCLANGESRLLIPKVTEHLKTSLYLAELFIGSKYSVSPNEDACILLIVPAK
jgi:RNA 3'-phosphate cyclase